MWDVKQGVCRGRASPGPQRDPMWGGRAQGSQGEAGRQHRAIPGCAESVRAPEVVLNRSLSTAQSVKPQWGQRSPALPRVTFQPEPHPDPSLLGSQGWHRVTGTGASSISRYWLFLQEKGSSLERSRESWQLLCAQAAFLANYTCY